MTAARLQTIEEIFHAALDQEPEQTSAFLDTACEGDQLLRRKVETLLASHQRASDFIETSAVGITTRIIENGQADLLVDRTIGHYKISKRIGAGGMGEVYLATDITAGRKAALKLLPARFTGNAERLTRFQQEARAVVGLNHPNILTVYEIGEDHSIHYIASELIEGEALRQRLVRGRMELRQTVDVAIQVATALAAAHEAGIVHRDIKPENIMLRPDGYVKVLDFGIAKLAESAFGVPGATADGAESMTLAETHVGSLLGTLRYMSPEQACGAPVDKRTDIWSLGVVLYEMITGQAPFAGDTPSEVMTSILEKEPPALTSYNKQTPPELQQITSKALRKDRTERYQRASEMLQALKNLHRKLESKADLERSSKVPSWLHWTRSPAAVALALLVGGIALALPFYGHRNLTKSLIPEKSVAVLPFENFSDNKENSYFGAAVQDEVLADLAKIADLKVISRTSVMQYKSDAARNLREIGQALGVAHVVEGSVQRVANRVRVTAQLIDARTDAHLWAETYDRDVADVFSIQSEIAQAIANQLQAKLSSAEKSAIEERPTKDLAAYDLYLRACVLYWGGWSNGAYAEASFFESASLLDRAVTRDPEFFLAYCQLALTHDALYFNGKDHTPARLALADAAIATAARLRPNSGEFHLLLAEHLYRGYLDYDHARAELALAQPTLPNNVQIFYLMALIDRRQGRWNESVRNYEKAMELDPRQTVYLQNTASIYELQRRFAEAAALLDRVLKLLPQDQTADEYDKRGVRVERASIDLAWRADPRPLHVAIEAIVTENPAAATVFPYEWFNLALCEHDPVTVNRALAAMKPGGLGSGLGESFPRAWFEGLAARARGDAAAARAAFASARVEAEATVREQPDYGPSHCVLGMIDAALGRKEDAIREGRRAVELLSVAKDSIAGAGIMEYLAIIYAWTGEKTLAVEQVAATLQIPSSLNYGKLRLHPFWDPLRSDPGFEKLVASLAPKSANK